MQDLIRAALAAPATHLVVTHYSDGTAKSHPTRNAAAAENFAIGERRKLGRSFIRRGDNAIVRVVRVEIENIGGDAAPVFRNM